MIVKGDQLILTYEKAQEAVIGSDTYIPYSIYIENGTLASSMGISFKYDSPEKPNGYFEFSESMYQIGPATDENCTSVFIRPQNKAAGLNVANRPRSCPDGVLVTLYFQINVQTARAGGIGQYLPLKVTQMADAGTKDLEFEVQTGFISIEKAPESVTTTDDAASAETTETTEITETTSAAEIIATTETLLTDGTTEETSVSSETTESPAASTDPSRPAEPAGGTQTESQPAFVRYTDDALNEMAIQDYKLKTGITPAKSDLTADEDGSVEITLFAEDGSKLDTYRVDAVTGMGTNAAGETVNLPQTGMTSPAAAAAAGAGAVLILCGAYAVMRSGMLRRSRDDEI